VPHASGFRDADPIPAGARIGWRQAGEKEPKVSVLMILRVPGDPAKLEEYAKANSEQLAAIAAEGREHGAIRHAFFGGDGEIVVVDEWDSEESFQSFFDSQQEIPKVMQEVATGEPQISFYRRLETGDDF
jgi:heme-degrading monooxygenase HmoA